MVEATRSVPRSYRVKLRGLRARDWGAFAIVGCTLCGCATTGWTGSRAPSVAADANGDGGQVHADPHAALTGAKLRAQSGRAALATGDLDAASNTLAAGLNAAPGDLDGRLDCAQAWLWRGVLARDAAQLARADGALQQVLLACPNHPLARRLAELLRRITADATPTGAGPSERGRVDARPGSPRAAALTG